MADLLDTIDPAAASFGRRASLLDRISSGTPVTPEESAQADQAAASSLNQFQKGLRRFGYSSLATTQAFVGQTAETVAPGFAKQQIASAMDTMRSMPSTLRPEYETFADAREAGGLRAYGSYAASKLGEGIPSTAVMLGAGLAGRGAAALAGAAPATRAIAQYGAGAAAMTPMEGGETALQIQQDQQAMANTTPAERTALTLGRGTVNAAMENIVPQLLIAPRLLGSAARIGTGFGNAARNTALVAGAGATGEYGTEVAQDITGQMALKQARGEQQGNYDWAQANEAGIGGAITGAVTGGIGGGAQALYSNIGQGVDRARERLPDNPADRFVSALRAITERPEEFGADAANMTLGALAKATASGKELGSKAGPVAAQGLDAGVEALRSVKREVDRFIINNVTPENRQAYIDMSERLESMTASEYQLFTAALRAETGQEFQYKMGAAGRALSETATNGVLKARDWAQDFFSGAAQAVRDRNGERQSLDMRGYTPSNRNQLTEQLRTASPEFDAYYAKLNKKSRDDVANFLLAARDNPSYFESGKEFDSHRQRSIELWKKETGTDLFEILRLAAPDERTLLPPADKLKLLEREFGLADNRGSNAQTIIDNMNYDAEAQDSANVDQVDDGLVDDSGVSTSSATTLFDENGNALNEARRDTTPFNLDSFRASMYDRRFDRSGEKPNLTIPVELSSDQLDARQIAQIFGKKVGRDDFLQFSDRELEGVDPSKPFRAELNPMSLASATGEEKFRELFAPYLPTRPENAADAAGFSEDKYAADKLTSALAALEGGGIEINPEALGLPPGDPIKINAKVNFDSLSDKTVIRRKGKGSSDYTMGDYTGRNRRLRSLAAQNKLMDSFNGDFGSVSEVLRKAGETNQTAKSTSAALYYFARDAVGEQKFDDLPAAEKTAQINAMAPQFAASLKQRVKDTEDRRQASSERTIIRDAYTDGTLTKDDVDAVVKFYRDHAGDGKVAKRRQIRSKAFFLQKSGNDDEQLDVYRRALDVLSTLGLQPTTSSMRAEHAEKLQSMIDGVDRFTENREDSLTGRVEPTLEEQVDAEFTAQMGLPEQRATTMRKALIQRAEERDPKGAAKGRLIASLIRVHRDKKTQNLDPRDVDAYLDYYLPMHGPLRAIDNSNTMIRLNEVGKRIAAELAGLTELQKQLLRGRWVAKAKALKAAESDTLEATIANEIDKTANIIRLKSIGKRIAARSNELSGEAIERLREKYMMQVQAIEGGSDPLVDDGYFSNEVGNPSGEKQSLDTGAKQNKAPENKLVDDYIAAIAESESGTGILFEGALSDTDAETTSAILNTLFDKERAKALHDNLENENEGLTDEEEQEVIDAAKKYFEFLSKQSNLNFDNTSPKDLESIIGQAIDQAATVIRLEAIGKRIAARSGELSKEATERLREKYKAKKEALKNPSKPAKELTEAQKEFVRRVEQLVGKRVAVLFNQNLGIGVAGSYSSRDTALDRVREERVAVINTLKTPFAEREGNQTDEQLQKALDKLNVEEQKILEDDTTLGIIRVATGMEERAGLAEHEAFHGAFQFFFDHNKEDRRVVVTAFSSGIVNRRLREYFKDSPAILDKITPTSKNFDEEETAAYGFQVWMYDPSALKLGERTQTIFEKIAAFFRGLFNIKTHEERALEVLRDLRSGKRAERGTSPLARQLDKNRPWTDRAQDFAKELGGVIKSGFDMLLSGTYSRLMDFENPAIATIARLGYNMTGQEGEGMVQRTRTETTRYYNELSKITEGMTEEERLQLQKDLVLGKRPTDGRVGRKYDQIKQLYADLYQYQTESGMQLGERKDYYPMIWDAEKVLENKEAFLTMLRQDKYKEDMRLAKKTPDEIWEDITAYFDRGDSLNNVMGTDNEPISESSRKRSLAFIEAGDRIAFMAGDPVQTGSLYIKQAVRHAEFVRAYGLGGSRLSALKRDAQKVYGATPDQIGLVNDYIDGLMGNKGVDMSRELKDTYGALVVYQNYRLLPFSLFSSLVDPMGVAVRSNSIGDAWSTFSYSMKNLFKEWGGTYTPDEWETIAADFGIITRAGTTVNADNLYTGVTLRGTTKKLNDAFFKYNLLNGWIRNNHIMATKAAQQFMYRASQDFFKGEGQNQRYLDELGVTKDDIVYDEQLGRILLTQDELEASGMSAEDAAKTAAKLRAATQKFVRQALLNPSSAELANWASNPYLAPIAHLKQFVWSFNATIIKRISHELENQNYAPIMMAAAYVPAMIAADFLKDLISNFGEEPPYKKDWDAVDYLWHGVNRTGLTGTGQFFVDAKEDIMRGGGGYESLAGPSLEQLKKAVAAFGSGDEAAMERWFVKSLPANAVYDQFVME